MSKVKIAVFVSGGGTNMQAIIDEIEQGNINGQIEMVISSNAKAFAIERAKKHGIKSVVISKNDYANEEEKNNEILKVLEENKIELIILAGYMSILDEKIIQAFTNKIINVHPALIPSFCGKGYYGMHVHEAVVAYGAKLSGATVHFVDEGTDTGPIILQEAVAVTSTDLAKDVAKKVLKIEHQLLPKAVKLYCERKITVNGRIVEIADK